MTDGMTEASEPQKKGRTKLSREEFLARMREGRRKAAERRAQEEAAQPEQEEQSDQESAADAGAPSSSATIEHRGQTLRKTSAKQIAARRNGRGSLEDVAQKHVARDAGLVDDGDDDDGSLPEPDDDAGSFHGVDDAVPAPAAKPELRDRATSIPDYADGDDTIRNLNDLMATYAEALRAGTCFVRVERIKPLMFEGTQIKGVQRRIEDPITEEEFEDLYGGGTYELIVYGPSEWGHGRRPDGTTIYRKKTRPLTVVVPLGARPPNIDALVDEDEDNDMQQAGYRGVRRTNADAQIHAADLSHAERREERARRDQRERIEEQRRRVEEAEQQSNGALAELSRNHERTLDAISRQHAAQMEMLQTQLAATERRLEQLMKSDSSKPTESMLVADLAKTHMQMKGTDPDELRRIQEDGAKAREQLAQRHNEELRTLREQHRSEVERIERQADEDRRRNEERSEATRRSCDERIREIQQQANDRVAEAEKRAERDVAHAKEDSDRRVSDLQRNYESRLNDLERTHKRDLSARDDSYSSRKESLENTHAMQLSTKDAELARLREENEKLRSEANKPLGERMQEFNADAEAMGFTKGEGEEQDWRSALAQGGVGLLGQLPELARTITQTLQARQQQQRPAAALAGAPPPQQLPPPVQGRGGGIAASREIGWATEDGPPLGADDQVQFDEPHVPGHTPAGPTRRPAFDGDTANLRPPPPAAPAAAGAPPQNTAPPQATQIVATQNPPRAADPPKSDQQSFEIEDAHIIEYAKGLQQAFDQGASPEEYVEYVKQQLGGPDMVTAITSSLDQDRIVRVLQQSDPSNSLVRRDGIKFLQAVWKLAQAPS